MKLSPREAEGYFAKPDAGRTGLLIYGGDAMRVALKRQQVIAALLGPNGEEEMRLTRMAGGDLRKDPAQLVDAIKAVGFFPGPRVAFVEECPELSAPAVMAALEDWEPGDAQIVVTAGQLKATSKLRKGFENHPNAYAVGIYDEPPSRAEIERMLAQTGIRDVPPEPMSVLANLARELGPGDFAQTLEKLALYKLNDAAPLSHEDIADCAPRSTEAGLDDLLNVVAEGKMDAVGPLLRRLQAQGTNPTGLCIAATRHFRTLYACASDPGGPGQGINRLRPPVYGPRRDRILGQAQTWGAWKLETALTVLTDTDLALRSAGQSAPQMPLVERAMIRLAMLSRSR